jgi:prephenate dehydratase/prephenate dehydrogenase/ferredoxin-fold anticodon binding domain-containing protein
LVIVGAAAGIGRWFGEHVLRSLAWSTALLLDASDAVLQIESSLSDHVVRERVAGSIDELSGAAREALRSPSAVVVLGVPLAGLHNLAQWLLPELHPSATVLDLSHDRLRADEILSGVRPDITVVGVHALVGVSATSAEGQTFVLSPSDDRDHSWVRDAIEGAGGTVNELPASRHDEVMRFVQAASHRALLTFVDSLHESGLDLERDLWANRTPVFEVLVALAARVLTPGQDAVTTSIQSADRGDVVGAAFRASTARLDEARATDESMSAYLGALREPFPGSLFTKIQQVGAIATSAVQSTRTEISRQRRHDGLVGVVALGGGDRLHVGHILTVTPTAFVLREELVGQPGRAALLVDDAAVANARRLGIGGKAKTVEFTLGRVRVLSNDELEAALDTWLPDVSRGVKVLVPESISGQSAVRVVEGVPGVRTATLVSEEVRLGQREIVIRVGARNDRNLDELERDIAARIDDVFVWPDGVVLPIRSNAVATIGFLGPAGTFSDTASRQLARLVGTQRVGGPDRATDDAGSFIATSARVEVVDFPTILRALLEGEIDLGVVPIANSSTGLVDLAADALLSADAELTAGGVVDVLVRFDAYVAPGRSFVPGLEVFTHPQVLRQCSSFIAAHNLVPVECTSTTEACRLVAERGDGVAIANVGLQGEVGLDLARTSVGNLAGAVTRFLVVGRSGIFAKSPRSDATLRSVWLVDDARTLETPAGTRFDEILHGPSGRLLVVSTAPGRMEGQREGVRFLGTFPWSPRTPVVVVS